MSLEIIELLSEDDRQAYADRLAQELLKPVVPWYPKTRHFPEPHRLPEPPPREAPALSPKAPKSAPRLTRPVAPRKRRSSRRVQTPVLDDPAVQIQGTERIVAPPIAPIRRKHNSDMPFTRHAFNADAAIERAGEAL